MVNVNVVYTTNPEPGLEESKIELTCETYSELDTYLEQHKNEYMILSKYPMRRGYVADRLTEAERIARCEIKEGHGLDIIPDKCTPIYYAEGWKRTFVTP